MSWRARQRGITLLEVIIAIAISSIIMGGLSTAIYMIVGTTQRGNDKASALQDLQNAVYWVSLDTQMANSTDLVDGEQPVNSLSLTWVDCDGNAHSSSYTLSGTELQRNYDSYTRTVAQYVTSIEFSISGDLLTYYIESTPPGRWGVSKNTTGEICLRPNT